MSRESFFTDVVLSYQKLSTTPTGSLISLRDYCRTRHVAWRDFLQWASISDVASELPGIKQLGKHTLKTKPLPKAPGEVSREQKGSMLYPLSFSGADCDEAPLGERDTSSRLRGIKITLPCGIHISIREGCGHEIARIIHSCNI